MIRNDIIRKVGLDEKSTVYFDSQDVDSTKNYGADAAQRRIGESSARIQESSESDEGNEAQRNEGDQEPGSRSYMFDFGLSGEDGPYFSVWSMGDDSPMITFDWRPLIGRFCDEPETPGFARILDPEWVDLELARRWKRDCFALHGDKCRNPLSINIVSPAWVIDTAQKCTVPGADISEYVALCYRWGGSAGCRTTRHLLKDRQEPGALSQGSMLGNSMAPILRHAIELTQAIDKRYLWVDAVCVVQDDETHLR